jgi:hypothetical protein
LGIGAANGAIGEFTITLEGDKTNSSARETFSSPSSSN